MAEAHKVRVMLCSKGTAINVTRVDAVGIVRSVIWQRPVAANEAPFSFVFEDAASDRAAAPNDLSADDQRKRLLRLSSSFLLGSMSPEAARPIPAKSAGTRRSRGPDKDSLSKGQAPTAARSSKPRAKRRGSGGSK